MVGDGLAGQRLDKDLHASTQDQNTYGLAGQSLDKDLHASTAKSLEWPHDLVPASLASLGLRLLLSGDDLVLLCCLELLVCLLSGDDLVLRLLP